MSQHPIAVLRQARGISLRALGAATRIPYVRIHHAEHGRQLTADELARIARVFGVPAETLALAPSSSTLTPSTHQEAVAS